MSGQSRRLARVLNGFIPLFVAAGVVFTLVVIGGKAVQGYELRQEASALEQRIDELKTENRDLSAQLDYYHSDQYVEKVAREQLGLIKEGDVAVVMLLPGGNGSPTSRTSPPVAPSPPAKPAPDTATWQRWLHLFVGRD